MNTNVLSELQKSAPLLQKALGGYLRWLAGQDWEKLQKEIEASVSLRRDAYRHMADVHPRLPTTTAKLRVALMMVSRYGRSIGLEAEWADAFMTLAEVALIAALQDQPRVEQATVVGQWLSGLSALLTLGRAKLVGKGDDLAQYDSTCSPIGWLVGEHVYLDPLVSYQEVTKYLGEQWRSNPSELHRQLLDATVPVEGHEEPVRVLAEWETTKGSRKAPKMKTVRNADAEKKISMRRARVLVCSRVALGVTRGGLAMVRSDEADGGDELDDALPA